MRLPWISKPGRPNYTLIPVNTYYHRLCLQHHSCGRYQPHRFQAPMKDKNFSSHQLHCGGHDITGLWTHSSIVQRAAIITAHTDCWKAFWKRASLQRPESVPASSNAQTKNHQVKITYWTGKQIDTTKHQEIKMSELPDKQLKIMYNKA